MKKILKYFLLMLLILIIFLPFFVSLEHLKKPLLAKVKQVTGRELVIAGKISFSILPQPNIVLNDVKFSSIKGTKQPYLIEAKQVSASVELLPLLSGKIAINNLQIIKPQLNLEMLSNGMKNWQFDFDRPSAVVQTNIAQSAVNEPALPFKDINIKDAQLNYIEGKKQLLVQHIDAYVDLSAALPRVDLRAGIDRLNLNDWSGANAIAKNNPASGTYAHQTPWSKSKIDLALFNSIAGKFNVKIAKLLQQEMEISDVEVKFSLKNGLLNIEHAVGKLHGGKLDIIGQVDSRHRQQVNFAVSLRDAQLKKIAPYNKQFKITDGLFNFSTKLSSYGQSQYEYISHLAGDIQFEAYNGKLHGLDLQKALGILDSIRNLDSMFGMLDTSFSTGDTDFQKMQARATVVQGVIDIDHLQVEANRISTSAQGKVNLPEYNLDVNALIKADVKNLPEINVKFYGPLNAVQHKLDAKALRKFIGRSALDKVVDKVTEGKIKPKEMLRKLEDKLFNFN